VAADVEIPAFLGRDDAEILALGFRTFAYAAGDSRLHFVRGAEALVAVLDPDGEADRILHAKAAPGGTDAALDGAECLGIGMAAFEACVDEGFPDVWELVPLGAEEIDTLAACDLGVETKLLRYGAQGDELFRRDFATRHTRHHGVEPAALDVGQEAVVG